MTQVRKPKRGRHVDLPDDLLMKIFTRLPANKLFAVERLSRKWQRCVGPVLKEVEVIVFGSLENSEPTCSHLQLACDNRKTLFVNVNKFKQKFQLKHEINDRNINELARLLTRCPYVKCLDFSQVIIFKLENLKKLVKVLPELECLSFGLVEMDKSEPLRLWREPKVDDIEWQRFAEEISPKLIHLKGCPSHLNKFEWLDGTFDWKSNRKLFDFLTTGDRIQSVHLDCSPNFDLVSYLDQLTDRWEVELSLDIDWLGLDYDFNIFVDFTFVFKLTPTSRRLFEIIDDEQSEGEEKSSQPKCLKIGNFSSQQWFVRLKKQIVFKTLKYLEMHSVQLDEKSFRCWFERLETLLLINTNATDDPAFEKLFFSMKEQLKKLVIRIDDWQPTCQYFPGKSLTVLKRLENLEIDMRIEKKRQFRIIEMFATLNQMVSLKAIEITLRINKYLTIPASVKKALVEFIALCDLPSTSIKVELRFNKQKFTKGVSIYEVHAWQWWGCQFKQLDSRYIDDRDVYKVQITTKK